MTTVLIVYEAHHLSSDTLEELRLLSNLETTEDKLLQIVLVGQPELDKKLDSTELRQLKQRIALRAQLGALTAQQTQEYIDQRLRIAGADSGAPQLFPPQAVAAVYAYSGGFRASSIQFAKTLSSAPMRGNYPWLRRPSSMMSQASFASNRRSFLREDPGPSFHRKRTAASACVDAPSSRAAS